jgi:hypothetical protein
MELVMIEQIVLGAFLIVPLIIVAFLFTDELWQERRQLHEHQPVHVRGRDHRWPLRLHWHFHSRRSKHDR